jgi:hypothetical protein
MSIPPALRGPGDGPLDGVAVGDIDRKHNCVGRKLADGLLERRSSTCDHCEARAFGSEQIGSDQSDA